jgi:hypothetical protein
MCIWEPLPSKWTWASVRCYSDFQAVFTEPLPSKWSYSSQYDKDYDNDDVCEDGSGNDGEGFLISNFLKIFILSKFLNAGMQKR